jgi:hypothetical protein
MGEEYELYQYNSALCVALHHGVTKRCRLSWLTNSALVYEPKCRGVGGVAGSQPMSTAAYTVGVLTPYLTFALHREE